MLKTIPKVDRLLETSDVAALIQSYGRPEVISALQHSLDDLRALIQSGSSTHVPSLTQVIQNTKNSLILRHTPSLRPLVNGTGVVVHTNLGRSPLALEAEHALHAISIGYSNLEFDLETGERGTRYAHVEELICELTGAEAALVVNNNAAAVILALSSLATGREVIVSRGELVEIGGSFRIPDVMRQSGALLVEVGATNRTHLHDFQQAIRPETALLLKVHTSNFAIIGFSSDTSLRDMATLSKTSGLPLMLDAGSGCLIDLSPYGINGEPTIRQHLHDGADIVTFSGDKLLGGPQAGIIAGKRTLLEPLKKHPLLRAVRIDKLTLAALEATLRLYRNERNAVQAIPTLRMLTVSAESLSKRANVMIRKLRAKLPSSVQFIKHHGESSAGGGSYPLLKLPTSLIEVRVDRFSPSQIESALRRTTIPVIGRIHRDRFLLDPRTIADHDLPHLATSLAEITVAGAP